MDGWIRYVGEDGVGTELNDLNEVSFFDLLVHDKVELDNIVVLESGFALLQDIEINCASLIGNSSDQVNLLDLILVQSSFFFHVQDLQIPETE